MKKGEALKKICLDNEPPPDTLVVIAHPDDEVIGLGGRLRHLKDASFIHVTDGAPEDMNDAIACGFKTRRAYAEERRNELFSALALASIDPAQCFEAGFADQESSHDLPEVAERLYVLIKAIAPEAVMTLAYEGGHPDHDSTSFGVHAACAMIEAGGGKAPEIIEFPLYHSKSGEMAILEFLTSRNDEITLVLSEEERETKKLMISRFKTQKRILSPFPLSFERFRLAPAYDFAAPPHGGDVFYDSFDWGIKSREWNALAREAMRKLGIKGKI